VFLVSGLAVLACSGSLVRAQSARTGGSANAQLVEQMQQLASERTALQAENARMKKELDDLRKDRDALKKAQAVVDTRVKESSAALARSTAERTASQQEIQQLKDKMQELIAKFRETVQTLRQVETEDATTKQTLATRDQNLKVCLDHNAALYKLNGEVLDRLEHQSMWSRVAAAEPFTRIKRVELENLVDDYHAKADDQHLKEAPATAAGAASSAPASIQPTASQPASSEPNGSNAPASSSPQTPRAP
jgi:chromosome segregation ATPase